MIVPKQMRKKQDYSMDKVSFFIYHLIKVIRTNGEKDKAEIHNANSLSFLMPFYVDGNSRLTSQALFKVLAIITFIFVLLLLVVLPLFVLILLLFSFICTKH